MNNDALVKELAPVLAVLKEIDLSDPAAAAKTLNTRLSIQSPQIVHIREFVTKGIADKWLCDREGGGAKFSRVAKSSPATENFSIDAVSMSGPGMWHRHTEGEIDLCFALSGQAKFDGHPEGWVVFGRGSEHVPTVTDGSMNILYFLPNGAIEWKR